MNQAQSRDKKFTFNKNFNGILKFEIKTEGKIRISEGSSGYRD